MRREAIATEHHLAAEAALIGGVFAHPEDLAEVAAYVRVDDFHGDLHRRMWGTLLRRLGAGHEPDMVDTIEAMARSGVPVAEALELIDRNAVSPWPYVQSVRTHAMVRRAKVAMLEGLQGIDQDDDPASAIEGLAYRLMDAAHEVETHPDLTAPELVDASLAAYRERADARQDGRVVGISTGLRALDRYVRFEPGRFYVIAARPGMGKSALAGHVIRSDRGQHRWGVISLEMPGREWMDRLLCAEACVDLHAYGQGWCTASDSRALAAAAPDIRRLRVRIADRGGMPWSQIVARARLWHSLVELDALVIDHMQIVGRDDSRMSTYEHLTAVSGQCKALAKDLEIPVILLSQLNRQVEQRSDKRPTMSDLRETGAIEQDADAVLMLYRERVYRDDADPYECECLIRKNRQGPTGAAIVRFDPKYTRFDDWPDRRDDDTA